VIRQKAAGGPLFINPSLPRREQVLRLRRNLRTAILEDRCALGKNTFLQSSFSVDLADYAEGGKV